MHRVIITDFKRTVQENLADGHLILSCYEKEVRTRTSFYKKTTEETKRDAYEKAGDLLSKLCMIEFDQEIQNQVAEILKNINAITISMLSEEWMHASIHADDVLLPPIKCVAIWASFLKLLGMLPPPKDSSYYAEKATPYVNAASVVGGAAAAAAVGGFAAQAATTAAVAAAGSGIIAAEAATVATIMAAGSVAVPVVAVLGGGYTLYKGVKYFFNRQNLITDGSDSNDL